MTLDIQSNLLSKALSALYQRLGKAYEFTKDKLALKDELKDSTEVLVADSDLLFVQTLSLPVSSLSAAKKTAGIMIERLSPLSVNDILWDIIGPVKTQNEHYIYRLGILKKQDLKQLNQSNFSKTHIKASTGEHFEFIDDEGFKTLGKNLGKWILLIVMSYAAVLWSLSQWGGKLEETANGFNQQSTAESRILAQSKANAAIIETEIALIDSFQNKSNSKIRLEELALISASLSDKDWLTSIENTAQRIQLSGYADKPAEIVRKLGAALPNANISLGSISADRVSGLNRFSITIVKTPQKNEISQ